MSRLSETPLFKQNSWRTQALTTGSWRELEPLALGDPYAPFLTALKGLDVDGFPSASTYNIDSQDFHSALGLGADNGIMSPTYNTGRAQAWACLLYFEVLDLLLAWAGAPSMQAERPFSNPSLMQPRQGIKIIKPSLQWRENLDSLIKQISKTDDINSTQPLSQIIGPKSTDRHHLPTFISATQIESLRPVLDYTEIQAKTLKTKTFKNLQAMAAGLLWVLEFGAEHVPGVNAGNIRALNPLLSVHQRYKNITGEKEKQLKGTSIEHLLRPLSYALNISPILAFCDVDLQSVHVDVLVQQEIRSLLSPGAKSSGLLYMEDCMHTLIRTICTEGFSAERVVTQHLQSLVKDLPTSDPGDTAIFKEVLESYKLQLSSSERPSGSSNAFTSRGLFQARGYETRYPSLPFAISSNIGMGPIARGLSQPPTNSVRGTSISGIRVSDRNRPASTMEIDDLVEGTTGDALQRPPVTSSPSSSSLTMPPTSTSQDSSSDQEKISAEVRIDTTSRHAGSNLLDANLRDTVRGDKLIHLPENDPGSKEGSSGVDETLDSPAAIPRRSTRLVNPTPIAGPGSASSVPRATVSIKRKRTTRTISAAKKSKANTPPADSAGQEEDETTDKAEVTDSDEDEPLLGLDSEWIDPDPLKMKERWWINDLREVPFPSQRSSAPKCINLFLPNGTTMRSFHYLGQAVSEHSEYPLIQDVCTSMETVRLRCSTAGSQFTAHGATTTIRPLTSVDPYLRWLTLSQWSSMTEVERVELWATGVDLYIYGMLSIPRVDDIRKDLTKYHRLDAPLEVQVASLRIPPGGEDKNANVDYTHSIRRTTLRTMLEHADNPDGLVLNALKLPSGHHIHTNPLLGRHVLSKFGLDLEVVAYRQTNGLPGFPHKFPPYAETHWELLGLAHSMTFFHLDVAATRVYVAGPGEKFWIRGRPPYQEEPGEEVIDSRAEDIEDSFAFANWDPDKADLKSCELEGVVLPAGTGTLLMQPGRKHMVIGTDTHGEDQFVLNRTATWTMGGHFVCASSIRQSQCVLLHMVMMENILTNADHVGMWQIMVRICAFWLNISSAGPKEDLENLAVYYPNLTPPDAQGWMDIIHLSCMIVLYPALDHRAYLHTNSIPPESVEADAVRSMYRKWRKWLATTYKCSQNGCSVDWEKGVFSCTLVHLAVTLVNLHQRQSQKFPEKFTLFSNSEFVSKIEEALRDYSPGTLQLFHRERVVCSPNTSFFVFSGDEFTVECRS
ncbi:hypothetical protein B0H11DRAFT_2279896 [Mycena galericulata]|nr:hypothetical protein B0H11DRAFT_2279896 [Mycena galericulata]